MYATALDDQFAQAVRDGLTRSPQKTLPCTYFYDDVGSALFEAITCLPEYGLTRADARILHRYGAAIAGHLPEGLAVVELGSGSGVKTRSVLEPLRRRSPVAYYPIDVSASSLAKCAQELGKYAAVHPQQADYLDGLRAVAGRRSRGQALLVLFLGSTIGNFEPDAAIDFLYQIRRCLEPGDGLLLGTDMVKDASVMLRAYDDPIGVTAAFNLNLLARINRELDADFDLRQFEHVALWDPGVRRIEMHLRSRRRQSVRIGGADLGVQFLPHETIRTESCHKFVTEQIHAMARAGGWRVEAEWLDEEWPFAESLLRAV